MNSSLVTLVCFAVKEEARPFARRVPPGSAVRVLVTGMGRANALRVVSLALKERSVGLVLSCGFAGALRPDLRTGTVVFSAKNTPQLESKLLVAGASPVHFHCSDRVAVMASEKKKLRESTGADAVEMESEPIGVLCEEHRVPHAVVRVILDAAGEDLPLDFNQLMTADLRVSPIRIAGAVARSPWKIARLVQLRNQSREAAVQLAEVLLRLTAEPAERG